MDAFFEAIAESHDLQLTVLIFVGLLFFWAISASVGKANAQEAYFELEKHCGDVSAELARTKENMNVLLDKIKSEGN